MTKHLLTEMRTLAYLAGIKAMEIYQTDFSVEGKADASPVTEADRLGEEIILAGLTKTFPEIPVLAEEAASEGKIPTLGERFFLVDPLDGTKEFINKTGEFTVNIGLIENGAPVMGVVYAPALGKLYEGAAGYGALLYELGGDAGLNESNKKQIKTRSAPEAGLTAVASRSHRSAETDAFLETLNVTDFAAAGSSLKFCLIAEGQADVYPRLGRTMEWDTGAGQAVLEAAGGAVFDHETGEPLRYGKESRGYDNPHFIAWGKATA
ncbi:MAG: 3'(2'),5'-bisphosphate nucleotidase CysQ [Pseudomonadota bacterium]